MRTSKDVIDRLLHDPAFTAVSSSTQIAFVDRFIGLIELPLRRFLTSEVPNHRIMYFRHASTILWHRETRLDTIFHTTDTEKAFSEEAIQKRADDVKCAMDNWRKREEEKVVRFGGLQRGCVHHFDSRGGDWIASPSCGGSSTMNGQIRIATLNVLHDIHLTDSVKSTRESRWDLIVQHVTSSNATIFVLTEATRSFANFILSDPKIRFQFASSDSPASDFHTLPSDTLSTSQLILVRRDQAVHSVYVTERVTGKRLVFINLSDNDMHVSVCGLHLTAGGRCEDENDKDMYINRRKEQLQSAVTTLEQIRVDKQVMILAGDFNFKDSKDEEACADLLEGFIEFPNGGFTFDPVNNKLAALSSVDGIPKRLDRIYASGLCGGFDVSPIDHHLFLAKPSIADNSLSHASDHYGIETLFKLTWNQSQQQRVIDVNIKKDWSKNTALAVLPSSEMSELVNVKWRSVHDPMYRKWPPHLNLIYPFVHPTLLQEAITRIRDTITINHAIHDVTSMSLGMENHVDIFRHRSKCTAFLKPLDINGGFQKLRSELYQSTVDLVGRSQESERDVYTPHLTIGKFRLGRDDDLRSKVTQEEIYQLGDEKIDTLSILQRIDGGMTVVDQIPLILDLGTSRYERTLCLMNAVTRRVFNEDMTLNVVGSGAILKDKTNTDIDIIITDHEDFKMSIDNLTRKIRDLLSGPSIVVRAASGSRCPIVHIDVGRGDRYLPVDIQWSDDKDDERDTLQDTQVFKEISKNIESFADSLIRIKKWAHDVQLTGRAFSLFGGISLTVMLACVTSAYDDTSDLVNKFFKFYETFDWKKHAISVTGTVERYSYDGTMVVVRLPTSDQNCASGVNKAVLVSFSKLCTSPSHNFWNRYEWMFEVYIEFEKDCERKDDVIGWIKGKFRQLHYQSLERNGISVRPSSCFVWNSSCDKAVLKCGIDPDLSLGSFDEWKGIVSIADTSFRDQFLRWDQRPADCFIGLRLVKNVIQYLS